MFAAVSTGSVRSAFHVLIMIIVNLCMSRDASCIDAEVDGRWEKVFLAESSNSGLALTSLPISLPHVLILYHSIHLKAVTEHAIEIAMHVMR